MKKGLLLIPYLKGYGGTETVVNNLLNQFDKNMNDLDVSLSTYSFGGSESPWWLKHNKVRIIYYPQNKLIRTIMYMISLPLVIPYLLFINKPDFVISTNPVIWFIAKKASLLLKLDINVIAWYHYSYELKPVKPIFLKSADKYFTISKTAKAELIEKDVDPKKIFVVYNPVLPSDKVIKHSDQHNILVYVGRTEYEGQKNISELFKALSKIKEHDWILLNYGVGPDKKELVDLSIRLGIEDNIKWMGFKENVFDYIEEADSLVLTSSYEGFSMVIAEAVSHGLFAVSSDCPSGPSELINRENGRLYNPGDINILSQLLENVIHGKYDNNHEAIKASINHLYINHYFDNFIAQIRNND